MTAWYRRWTDDGAHSWWSPDPQYPGQLPNTHDFPLTCPVCGAAKDVVRVTEYREGWFATYRCGAKVLEVPIAELTKP